MNESANANAEILLRSVFLNPFIPHEPTDRQAAFLVAHEREVLYGGAAGGGKSDALLMAALQWVEVPTYSALLLRRTYADLSLPGGLIPRSYEWLQGTGATYNEQLHQWRFPSGAKIVFGYMEHANDVYRYQSSEFQFIGWDELTQILESQYTYLISRLRRGASALVPLRIRAASNPGGIGHDWVYNRFVAPGVPATRRYIPARLEDNPHLDRESYDRSLRELDDTLRDQLRYGKWITDPRGKPFNLDWWKGRNRYDDPRKARNRSIGRWLSYDTASKTEDHNAYTAYVAFDMQPDYRVAVTGVWKDRVLGADVPDVIVEHALKWNEDGKLQGIVIEDQSSGTVAIQTLGRRGDWIANKIVSFNPAPFGDKLKGRPTRAAVWCKRGCILLPVPHESAAWLLEFTKDLSAFPEAQFKDTIDAFNQGVIYLEHYIAEGWRGREGFNQ